MKQFACPVDGCDFRAGSRGSVKAHITRMVRDGHKGLSGPDFGDQITAVDVDETGSSTADHDGADPRSSAEARSSRSGGVVPADHRVPETATDGGSNSRSDVDCCTSPDLVGSAGDYFRLESGDVVQLESGDRICANCDELHE